jgi:hypothetical protein
LHGLRIHSGALHANEEVILVLNEEDEHVLTETVFRNRHIVLWVGQHSRLEDGGKICSGHLVEV